jgi:hypothetical protein
LPLPESAIEEDLMSTAVEIVTAFKELPRSEQDEVLQRLEEIWENQLPVRPEFLAKVEEGLRDLQEGRIRTRRIGTA